MTTRRRAIKTILAGAAAVASNPEIGLAMTEKHAPVVRKGNIRHSVCRWCYSGFSLDQLCVFAKQIGISAIDLIGPDEWHILKSHGLDSSMCNGAE
ncbi:MAG: hydroxypyruvate isomerase, partial [Bacteroidota bacterium]